VLNNTIWGYFDPKPTYYIPAGCWLDIVGFRKKDGISWERLEAWRRRCFLLIELPRGALLWGEGTWRRNEFIGGDWGDVTREWSGEWVRYTGNLNEKEKRGNSRKIISGMGWGFGELKGWTVNGNEGRVILRVEEKASLEMWVEDTRDEEYQPGHVQDPDLAFGVNPIWLLVREVTATITV
jgi:hypothetical protein